MKIVLRLIFYGTFIVPVFGQVSAQELDRTARDFFETWIVKQDLDTANSFFDQNSISNQIKATARSKVAPDINVSQWTKSVLRMWLLQDHGLVNKLGHGDPNDPRTLQVSFVGPMVKFESLDQALEKPAGTDRPYTIDVVKPDIFPWVKETEGEFWITPLKFKHVSGDQVIVGWSAKNGKIVAFTWLIH
ncbi:MAG: hypothetical protein A3J28_06885 [Acidobacteria bacterium RIFCSPLOWO2_12_FULL_60_22]|nr:MAG: hypothetical protein A3J28_06885 [Acidobacteria bacterium RIFCSPLOWO2_12_FULL_60_22]